MVDEKCTSSPMFEYDLQPLTMQLDSILSACIPILLMVPGCLDLNLCPVEPGYALPLQTV